MSAFKGLCGKPMRTLSEDPGPGLTQTTWTQHVLFSLVNELISILLQTVAKKSKYTVFTGQQVKKPEQLSSAFEDSALLTASASSARKMVSASLW